jgi:hypothetical protein
LFEALALWIVLVAIIFDTFLLALGIMLFQEQERTIFRQKGTSLGWVLCATTVAITVLLSLLPFWHLLPLIAWWAMALQVLKLSVRQALQLNVLTVVCHLAFVFGVVALIA